MPAKVVIPGAKYGKLKKTSDGRLASAKSKTGNPACSQAMSSWVRARHGGPPAGAEVFKMLARCRSMARQNKQAAAQQASGKLAEGRGTWQRSEKAATLKAQRAERRATAPPPAAKPAGPSLKEQADAARASRGWPPEKRAELAASMKSFRRAIASPAPIVGASDKQAAYAAAVRKTMTTRVDAPASNPRDAFKNRVLDLDDKHDHRFADMKERAEAAGMGQARAILDAYAGPAHSRRAARIAEAAKNNARWRREWALRDSRVAAQATKPKPTAPPPPPAKPAGPSLREQADASRRAKGNRDDRRTAYGIKLSRAYKKQYDREGRDRRDGKDATVARSRRDALKARILGLQAENAARSPTDAYRAKMAREGPTGSKDRPIDITPRTELATKPKTPPAGISRDRLAAARQALKADVPPELRAKVIAAFRKVDDQADAGAPVPIAALRRELADVLPRKPQVDRVLRKLKAEGVLNLHRSDRARVVGETERAGLVREGLVGGRRQDALSRRASQNFYVGAGLRAGAAPAQRRPPRPGTIIRKHSGIDLDELKRLAARPTTIDGEDFARRADLKGQTSLFSKVGVERAGAKAPGRGDIRRANLAERIKKARKGAADPRSLTPNFGRERMEVRAQANAAAYHRKTTEAAPRARANGPDHRRETPANALQANADRLWAKAQKLKAAGSPDAAGTFAHHDELMSRLRRAADARARAGPPPAPVKAAPPERRAAVVARLNDRLASVKGQARGLAASGDTAAARGLKDRFDALKARRDKVAGKATEATSKPAGKPAEWRSMVQANKSAHAARRNRKAARLKSQRAELAESRNATVRDLDVSKIDFDPKRFQYKLAHAEGTGSVGPLAGVKKWDPELGGVVQVWRDPADGKTYVVNGHNRLDLAKRMNAGKISVRYVQANSASEARAKGAITNIAEGRGTAIDAAKFFRDEKMTRADLEGRGVPMREKIATDGTALAALEPTAFRRVVDGDLPVERAAIVGGAGLTEPQQRAVFALADKRRGEINNKVLRELVTEVKQSSSSAKGGGGLFGDDPVEESNALHRAALKSHVKERLGREKRVFGTVAKSNNATALARANNVIDADASGKVSREAAENLATFDLLASRKSATSALIAEGERRLAAGESPKAVYESIYKRVPEAVRADSR